MVKESVSDMRMKDLEKYIGNVAEMDIIFERDRKKYSCSGRLSMTSTGHFYISSCDLDDLALGIFPGDIVYIRKGERFQKYHITE